MPVKLSDPHIQFHFLQPSAIPQERKRLKAFILSIFRREKTQLASLTYIFCSDAYLLAINQQFLQHNYYTDIISFNPAVKNEPVEGEIYISLDRVRENAQMLGQTYKDELHRVIFHGVLHFCGYKDKQKKEKDIMREKENHYLSTYFQ